MITAYPARKPRRLKSWEQGLVNEMKFHLYEFTEKYGYVYTPKLGKKIEKECAKELSRFDYDMKNISVVCSECNNTPERSGLWIDVFIGFGHLPSHYTPEGKGDVFALLTYQHDDKLKPSRKVHWEFR